VRVKSLTLPAVAVIVVAAIALALAHGRGGATQTASLRVVRGHAARLTIANYAFTPQSLVVSAGTTIMVRNTDSTDHTATARSGAFDTGTIKPGQTARFTITNPGTYPYYCQFHAFMTGTITVVR
jgi:plastocyanin